MTDIQQDASASQDILAPGADLRRRSPGAGVAEIPGPEGEGIPAGLVGAWTRALPLPAEQIAGIWLGLAHRIRRGNPAQALELLRVVHALHPAPGPARALGFALIEAGEGRAALEVLESVAGTLRLSSREDRLLALAHAGHDGPDLRARAARAVARPLRLAGWLKAGTTELFAPECDLLDLPPAGWESEIGTFRPELFLVEASQAKVAGPQLRAVLDWCRHRDVPTALWINDAPLHHHATLALARPFDVVLVADPTRLAALREGLGHGRVHLLPFACQPKIHNPLRDGTGDAAIHVEHWDQGGIAGSEQDFAEFLAPLSREWPAGLALQSAGESRSPAYGVVLDPLRGFHTMVAPQIHVLLARGLRPVVPDVAAARQMFGDLVIATPTGAEAAVRLRQEIETDPEGRIRLAGLRRALSEHTAAHRLAEIADKAGLTLPATVAQPRVTVLAQARNGAELAALYEAFARQTLAEARMVLVLEQGVEAPAGNLPPRVRLMSAAEAERVRLGDLAGPEDWIAGMVAQDYHGPQYLTDLQLATGWSDAELIGKAARFRASPSGLQRIDGPVHATVAALPLRGALISGRLMPGARLDRWLRGLPGGRCAPERDGAALAVDPFSYCEDGATGIVAPEEIAAAVDDLPDLDTGTDLARIAALAGTAKPGPVQRAPWITGADLGAGVPPSPKGEVAWSAEGQDWVVSSRLDAGKHAYFYEIEGRPIADFVGPDGYPVHIRVTPGLHISFVAEFLDAATDKIEHQMLNANRTCLMKPPAGTAFVRFGIRVAGAGQCRVQRMVLGDPVPAPEPREGKHQTGILNRYLALAPAGTQIVGQTGGLHALAGRGVDSEIVGMLGADLRAMLGARAPQAAPAYDRYDLGWEQARPRYLVVDVDAMAELPGWEHALTLRDPPATVELAVMVQKARAAGIATVLVPPAEPHRFPLLSRVAGLFDLQWIRGQGMPEALRDQAA